MGVVGSQYQIVTDADLARFTDTLGIALNAWTGYIQHDREVRIKDKTERDNKKAFDNLFGDKQRKSFAAFRDAVSLVA